MAIVIGGFGEVFDLFDAFPVGIKLQAFRGFFEIFIRKRLRRARFSRPVFTTNLPMSLPDNNLADFADNLDHITVHFRQFQKLADNRINIDFDHLRGKIKEFIVVFDYDPAIPIKRELNVYVFFIASPVII